MSAADGNEDELKRRAVCEILEETKRAAIRADIGGSLGWAKPNHGGFNKRFLYNTVISTVSNNCRQDKNQPSQKKLCTRESPSSSTKVLELNTPLVPKNPPPKIKVNSKSRFQAYLVAKQRAKERQLKEVAAEVVTEQAEDCGEKESEKKDATSAVLTLTASAESESET